MTVEIICVGTELLLGNIVNTNAAYLAQECAKLGLSNYYQSVVGDNEERLTGVLVTAMDRSDVVILSGGLGPTEDDLTKEVAAKVCGRELIVDEACMEHIAEYFASRDITPTENNWKQAKVPEGAKVLENNNGTAPGILIEDERAKVILLPGPPKELVPMFEESVAPYLDKLTPGVIESRTVKICGGCESEVETLVKDLIDSQNNPTIAPYAKTGEVHLRVTASAKNSKEANKRIAPVVKELYSRFGESIYTTDENVSLEKAVVDLLLKNKLSLACAESCTGGLLSATLINVPGVSEVYKTGFVTYTNKAKRKALGVKKSTLLKYDAVSEKVASEMAKGAANVSKADVTVSVTGLAGPGGGTKEIPVGTVYIGCSVKGKTTVKEYHFKGNREKIRDNAVSAALTLMRSCILQQVGK